MRTEKDQMNNGLKAKPKDVVLSDQCT